MDFFSSIPSQVEAADADDDDELFERLEPEWRGPPSTVLGAPVALSGVVYRSEHAFVGLRFVTAYPTGVIFGLQIAVRRGDWSRERWNECEQQFWGHAVGGSRGDAVNDVMIGVELANGRRTATTTRFRRWPIRDETPDPPQLIDHGGSGSGGGRIKTSQRSIWLWPFPDGDSLDLVLAWPALDMPETRYTVDVRQLRTAAAAALPYWES
jgi:hypothetical protein